MDKIPYPVYLYTVGGHCPCMAIIQALAISPMHINLLYFIIALKEPTWVHVILVNIGHKPHT